MNMELVDKESVAESSQQEELITMRELCNIAGKEMGNKTPLHIATIRTWITRGKQGVVLETFKRLGVRLTTKAMWEKFKEEVANVDQGRCEKLRKQLQNARKRKKGLEDQAQAVEPLAS
jgi:hypothetical protein